MVVRTGGRKVGRSRNKLEVSVAAVPQEFWSPSNVSKMEDSVLRQFRDLLHAGQPEQAVLLAGTLDPTASIVKLRAERGMTGLALACRYAAVGSASILLLRIVDDVGIVTRRTRLMLRRLSLFLRKCFATINDVKNGLGTHVIHVPQCRGGVHFLHWLPWPRYRLCLGFGVKHAKKWGG